MGALVKILILLHIIVILSGIYLFANARTYIFVRPALETVAPTTTTSIDAPYWVYGESAIIDDTERWIYGESDL